MKYVAPIDVHVHLRGSEYVDHHFTDIAINDAIFTGLAAMIDMPNCMPFPCNENSILTRLAVLRAKSARKGIKISTHALMINDHPNNIATLKFIMNNNEGVVSDMCCYGDTYRVNGLSEDMARNLWYQKGEMHYKGVSLGHFISEKECSGTFSPSDPVTHSEDKNPRSETACVEEQLRQAYDACFRGTFYVCHVSSHETIDFLHKQKKFMPFNIVTEVTWPHCLLNIAAYRVHGNRVKCDPPLRPRAMAQGAVLERILRGWVDVISSDHAPHPIPLKDSSEPPSGVPSIPIWPYGIFALRRERINENLLEDITFNNANRLFNLNCVKHEVDIDYQRSLWDDYGYNPYSMIDTDYVPTSKGN